MFLSYIINNRDHLEKDVAYLMQNVRYRNIDIVDLIELIIAIERLNAFNDFAKQSMIIFDLVSKKIEPKKYGFRYYRGEK